MLQEFFPKSSNSSLKGQMVLPLWQFAYLTQTIEDVIEKWQHRTPGHFADVI